MDAPEEILAKTRRLQEITTGHGVPLHVAALHFAGAHPAIASLVIGSATAAEADDNRAIWDVEPPAAMWQELHQSGLIADRAPLPGLTARRTVPCTPLYKEYSKLFSCSWAG